MAALASTAQAMEAGHCVGMTEGGGWEGLIEFDIFSRYYRRPINQHFQNSSNRFPLFSLARKGGGSSRRSLKLASVHRAWIKVLGVDHWLQRTLYTRLL